MYYESISILFVIDEVLKLYIFLNNYQTYLYKFICYIIKVILIVHIILGYLYIPHYLYILGTYRYLVLIDTWGGVKFHSKIYVKGIIS